MHANASEGKDEEPSAIPSAGEGFNPERRKRIAEAPSLFSAWHPPNGPTANLLAGFASAADISVQPKRLVIVLD